MEENSMLHELFLGDIIWAPAVFGIYITVALHSVIRAVEGPVRVGRIVLHEAHPELIVWGIYSIVCLWCLVRQINTWVF